MKQRSLGREALLKILGLDLLFAVAIPFAYAKAVGMGVGVAYALLAPLSLVRMGAFGVLIARAIGPADHWSSARPSARTEAITARAVRALALAPARIGAAWGGGYLLVYVLVTPLVYFLFPDQGLSSRVVAIGVLTALCPGIGAPVLGYPLVQLLTEKRAVAIATDAASRGIEVDLPQSSLRTRIAVLAMLLAACSMPWSTGVGYRTGLEGSRQAAVMGARSHALEIALGLKEAPATDEALARLASAGEAVVVSTSGGKVTAGPADLVAVAQTKLRGAGAVASGVLGSRELVWARASIDESRAVVVVAHVDASLAENLLYAMGAFAAILVVWAALSAVFFGGAIASAVERLTDASARIVEVGDLRAMGELPILQDDEIGATTRNFNALLRTLRDVTGAAQRVADGQLSVTIDGVGDLPDAFRGMVEKLRLTVSQLRDTSIELATAATQIYSAAQEQETASTEQSGGMTEVTQTMISLAQASAHVAESVGGVLKDAERARENSDLTADRIAELNRHSQRISELLDVIREVADRTDLLALNGSLEATRAGEAGRGFSLVAAEMRRLAERVKSTVDDVRTLVTDVKASGAATVMATDQSRKLVESTTEAARRITHVTQQQRSATEAVSASVRDIASVLAQAAAATTQTRVAAEALKHQATQLEQLVQRFQLEDRTS